MQQKWAWHSTIDIESEKWDFLTMYEVKFVTSHEVINTNVDYDDYTKRLKEWGEKYGMRYVEEQAKIKNA